MIQEKRRFGTLFTLIIFTFLIILSSCSDSNSNKQTNDIITPETDEFSGLFAYQRGDYETAFKKALPLAERGDDRYQLLLGDMYKNGQGVSQDYAIASGWYSKAAEKGHSAAQVELAEMYIQGQGVHRDYQKAFYWFRKAGDQGNVGAQFNVGVMYYTGQGVSQDYAEAVHWYIKAAEQEHVEAQFNLGYMYFEGKGAPPNHSEAVRLFSKAAKQGSQRAKSMLHEIESTTKKEYFPLSVGNSWTYIRTVEEDVEIPFYIKLKGSEIIGGVQNIPESSEETYTITKERFLKQEKYLAHENIIAIYDVQITGERVRNGRYSFCDFYERENEDHKQIEAIWGYQKSTSYTTIIEWIPGEYPGESDGSIGELYIGILTPYLLLAHKNYNRSIMAIKQKGKLSVPAGTFYNCIKSVAMVKGENLSDILLKDASPKYKTTKGFLTESFFAEGIGLIKEVQYNNKGNITYTLELKSYKVLEL